MGLFDRLKGELVDIIEWNEEGNETMVWRFPRYENEIKNGAKLIVRESQTAVFVNKGQLADIFTPGIYELSTDVLPVLSSLQGWAYGFHSPFKAEVYFANMRQFANRKWGTKNPITLRDPEFGVVRLRAFGTFSLRIVDSARFIQELVGTQVQFQVNELSEQLKNRILARFADALGEAKMPLLDLAAHYDELSEQLALKMERDFLSIGLELAQFSIENISLPPEVEAALDKRTSMNILGNQNQYGQFQMANAMEAAAKHGEGSAFSMAGMAAGLAFGQQLVEGRQQAPQSSTLPPTPPPLPTVRFFVAVEGQQKGPFDSEQLWELVKKGSLRRTSLVWRQGLSNWTAAEQVSELSDLFAQLPPPLPPNG